MEHQSRTVSPFEYAIMQAVHESNPDQVTKEDLEKVRPETDDEKRERLTAKFQAFANRIKVKSDVTPE